MKVMGKLLLRCSFELRPATEGRSLGRISSKLSQLLGSLGTIAGSNLSTGRLDALYSRFEIGPASSHSGFVGRSCGLVGAYGLALGSDSVAMMGHRLLVLPNLLPMRSDCFAMPGHCGIMPSDFSAQGDVLVDAVGGSCDTTSTTVKTSG
jgi:hypothetical protein